APRQRLRGEEGALEIEVENRIPVVFLNLECRARAACSGIVDQNVRRPVEAGDHVADGLDIRDVDGNGARLAAIAVAFAAGFLDRVGPAGCQGDGSAVASQQRREMAPQPRGGPGDEGGFPGKVKHATLPLPPCCLRETLSRQASPTSAIWRRASSTS